MKFSKVILLFPILFLFSFYCQAKQTTSTVNQAIMLGLASVTDEKELFQEAIKQAKKELESCYKQLSALYPFGQKVVQFPSIRTDHFVSLIPDNYPLFSSHTPKGTDTYAWIGEKNKQTRYAVMGTNVLAFDIEDNIKDIKNNLHQELKDTTMLLFRWLLKEKPGTNIFTQNIQVLVYPKPVGVDLKEWFSENKINNNWKISSDLSKLKDKQYDILLSNKPAHTSYEQAILDNKAVLIWKNWVKPNQTMLDFFGLKWTGYKGKQAGNWDSIKQQCLHASSAGKILTTLNNLYKQKLNFNYTSNACIHRSSKTICSANKLKDNSGKTLTEKFLEGAEVLKNQLAYLDKHGILVFNQDENWRLLKIVVLLAEKLRTKIHYPMDKESTNSNLFYRAYFADHVVHYSWLNNSQQSDLGDFTTQAKKLTQLKTFSADLRFKPGLLKEWTSTGYYMPPGKVISLYRTDFIKAKVAVKFNMLRDGTTHLWSTKKYTRPAFLQSSEIFIEQGKRYSFSSPYGGPIYISAKALTFPSKKSVKLQFEGILKHPFIENFTVQKIKNFKKNLFNSPFDWIDIKTPYVEIHSRKSKMLKAIKAYKGDLDKYIADLNQYLIISNLSFAGFIGEGLKPINKEIKKFCTVKKLDCLNTLVHQKPKIQHINSDIHASCGTLCAGNPFDSSRYIRPLGWGEAHELGHNLQRDRLKVYDRKTKEVSNNIFPTHMMTEYAKENKQIFFKKKSKASASHKKAFAILQEAISKSIKPGKSHPLWRENSRYAMAFERLAFYVQLAFVNKTWDIYTIMYLIERLYTKALNNEKEWLLNKDKLGFSSYTRDQAKKLSGEDFIYITVSYFSNMDHQDYFTAWGILVSEKAKLQVKSNGFEDKTPAVFYYVPNRKIYAKMPHGTKNIRALDGKTPWIN